MEILHVFANSNVAFKSISATIYNIDFVRFDGSWTHYWSAFFPKVLSSTHLSKIESMYKLFAKHRNSLLMELKASFFLTDRKSLV